MDKFYKWLTNDKRKNPAKFEIVDIETRIGYMISYLIEQNDYVGLHIELPLTIDKMYNTLKNRIFENGLR